MNRTVAPTALPITVDDVKQNLNLPLSDASHDRKLGDLIQAATDAFENDTDRVCMQQTFQLSIGYLPDFAPIDLYKRPLIAVDEIAATDTDGNPVIVDPSVYVVSQGRRQVWLAHGQSWPAHINYRDSVTITFRAGAATVAEVPRMYRAAISLWAGSKFLDPGDERKRDVNMTSYDNIVRSLFTEKEI